MATESLAFLCINDSRESLGLLLIFILLGEPPERYLAGDERALESSLLLPHFFNFWIKLVFLLTLLCLLIKLSMEEVLSKSSLPGEEV
ncbi:hypothetical protein VIGAN_UM065400 [Vigna angularis var. angularis]|uniref:Uncharacterized protein n=1 Tax=Vigna angularis var. angularis TaxID=157739 RepID=A0A0S3TDS6_PHAAN|nr:hypothetical protein VIGAN_UM065400 [Vigna angularis var. angularis]